MRSFQYLFRFSELLKLEYKRVVIQNYALCLRYLIEEGSFSKAMRRATLIQRQRRPQTLASILAYILDRIGEDRLEVPQEEPLSTVITQRAISYLRNAIRNSWKAFDTSVGKIVDRMSCQRAKEQPRETQKGAFDLTVHQLECKTKRCNVANFFRSNGSQLRAVQAALESMPDDVMTAELKAIKQSIDDAFSSPERLYNYTECLRLGDLWLHLECLVEKVSEFATRNRKESEVLCKILKLNMRTPQVVI